VALLARQARPDPILEARRARIADERELARYRRGEIERAEMVLAYARDPLRPLAEKRIKVWAGRRLVPLQPFATQEELLRAWIDCELLAETGELRFRNVHVEKSRQVGDTVILAYGCLWALTYYNVALLMQHQDLGEVADGGADATWDSFFGKIRLLWSTWPAEIGRAELRFRQKPPLIRNVAREQSYLVGEGETPDPGRGGTYDASVRDEAARLAYAEAAEAALDRACPTGRVDLSTPHGEDNVFARTRRDQPAGITFLRHHWSQHPGYGKGTHVAGSDPKNCEACAGVQAGLKWDAKNPTACHRYPGKLASPWYDLAVVRLTDEQVAMELDIDYAASLSARVYPEFQEERHLAAIAIPWDWKLPLELGFDYGSDTTAVVICQEAPKEYRVIGEVELHDTRPEEVVAALRAELKALGLKYNDLLPDITRTYFAIGDVAGEARSAAGGHSAVSEYGRHGFSILSRRQLIEPSIWAVKRLLLGQPKELVISQRCRLFLEHIKHHRWPVDRQGNRKPGAPRPENNRHAHMMDAFRYLTAYKWPAPDLEEALAEVSGPSLGSFDASGRLDELGYETKF
jgi:hypothetical protein